MGIWEAKKVTYLPSDFHDWLLSMVADTVSLIARFLSLNSLNLPFSSYSIFFFSGLLSLGMHFVLFPAS